MKPRPSVKLHIHEWHKFWPPHSLPHNRRAERMPVQKGKRMSASSASCFVVFVFVFVLSRKAFDAPPRKRTRLLANWRNRATWMRSFLSTYITWPMERDSLGFKLRTYGPWVWVTHNPTCLTNRGGPHCKGAWTHSKVLVISIPSGLCN